MGLQRLQQKRAVEANRCFAQALNVYLSRVGQYRTSKGFADYLPREQQQARALQRRIVQEHVQRSHDMLNLVKHEAAATQAKGNNNNNNEDGSGRVFRGGSVVPKANYVDETADRATRAYFKDLHNTRAAAAAAAAPDDRAQGVVAAASPATNALPPLREFNHTFWRSEARRRQVMAAYAAQLKAQRMSHEWQD
jgi:hypothetical protein